MIIDWKVGDIADWTGGVPLLFGGLLCDWDNFTKNPPSFSFSFGANLFNYQSLI